MTVGADGKTAADVDPLMLGRAIVDADRRAAHALNLVPSENRISPLAALPLGSDFYNRYFFNTAGDPLFWEFRGGEDIAHIEALGAQALRRMASAQYCNVRPISGMSAMILTVAALSAPGRTVVSIDQNSGGHYATPALLGRMGRHSRLLGCKDGQVDESELADVLAPGDVDLVYVDVQNCVRVPDFGLMADVVNQVSPATRLYVDASHYLGLVLGGLVENPLACGADAFGGSTHKSFPGPHKGVIFTNAEDVDESLRSAQFDMVSSHHFAETLALSLSALEVEPRIGDYAWATTDNARRLACALADAGFRVYGDSRSGYTDTHQVWVELDGTADAYALSNRLAEAGIRVNLQSSMPGMSGVHLRLGSNEVTFEGAGPQAIEQLAGALATARERALEPRTVSEIRGRFGAPFYTDPEKLKLEAGL
uniref:Hydroxymethyltransferase n=1 Tax=Streptomyces sp. SN-1061M TaxID=722721 RepID=D3X718_9ACTN|nr:hydroxymethyltransferase [Streptomyces sp. SN-1061M]